MGDGIDSLIPLRIASVGNRPRAAWAEGQRIHLPADVFERAGWRRALTSGGDLRIPDGPPPIASGDVARLREARAFTDRPPLSARLPFSYRTVPGWARAAIASIVGRSRRRRVDQWAAFPGWPIDLSADALDDLRGGEGGTMSGPTPVLLTHDIDSAEGLTGLVRGFLPIEEAAGARSTSYIVPCDWRVDEALVGEITARGHAVGVHGYDHSNTTAFAAADERRRRLDAGHGFARRHGASGYRAPSLLRTRALLRDLGARYRYDSSIPTAGGLFPTPNNGCATARPFVVEGIAELPITLPRDGMLRFLGHTPAEIVRIWVDCAELVARSRGVVVLLTHCERRFSGSREMVAAYREFVAYLRERPERFAFSTPIDVLRSRGMSQIADQ